MKTWILETCFMALVALTAVFTYAASSASGRRRRLRAAGGAGGMGPAEGNRARDLVTRVLAIGCSVQGLYYIAWRYGWSLNTHALWFAVPLVAAETYALIDSILFAIMMWKPAYRTAPPPLDDATVDVFITTYNEPVDLVRTTAEAAARIDWPRLRVHVLDDGARPAMETAAREAGWGYISRGAEWAGKPRHAKAGNVNNALLQTTGDFILILDADQIPSPRFVKRTIGYFRDPKLAFVQTPQHFYNVPPGDPFASDAPLFYGPILRGKDGWNAAFFCGSNALLRREALLQLGLTEYAREMHARLGGSLDALQKRVATLSRRHAGAREPLRELGRRVAQARRSIGEGAPLERVGRTVQEAVRAAQQAMARADARDIAESLDALAAAGDAAAADARRHIMDTMLADLAPIQAPDAETLGVSQRTMDDLSLTRPEEAIPVLSLATISITEDMATAMRLHAAGWRSVYHSEILAHGLAPEDLGSALGQRLRWAQGTLQVLLRENPLFKKGLSAGQRLQYSTTIYSYFSGFASLVFLLSPVAFGFTGIGPVAAWDSEFFWRFIPFFLLNQAMYRFVAWGTHVHRGEQYSLALFPVWIRAVVGVFAGLRLSFVVTPKERQSGTYLRLVIPQIAVAVLTIAALAYCVFSYASGNYRSLIGLAVNLFWSVFNIGALSAIIRAAVYRPPAGWKPAPPTFVD
jgi:cellulose synthase (UDP-forming)